MKELLAISNRLRNNTQNLMWVILQNNGSIILNRLSCSIRSSSRVFMKVRDRTLTCNRAQPKLIQSRWIIRCLSKVNPLALASRTSFQIPYSQRCTTNSSQSQSNAQGRDGDLGEHAISQYQTLWNSARHTCQLHRWHRRASKQSKACSTALTLTWRRHITERDSTRYPI